MTLTVGFAPQAREQVRAIDTWWRSYRQASPGLFTQELAEAVATIAIAPESGTKYFHWKVKGVRRVLMRATRHHVYYVVVGDTALVLAVWGAVKRRGPKLSSPH